MNHGNRSRRRRRGTRMEAGMFVAAAVALLAGAGAAARTAGPSAGDHKMMAAMRSMKAVTGRTRPTGDVDHDFMTMMIPHHEAAIDMARIEVRQGRDPRQEDRQGHLRRPAQGRARYEGLVQGLVRGGIQGLTPPSAWSLRRAR